MKSLVGVPYVEDTVLHGTQGNKQIQYLFNGHVSCFFYAPLKEQRVCPLAMPCYFCLWMRACVCPTCSDLHQELKVGNNDDKRSSVIGCRHALATFPFPPQVCLFRGNEVARCFGRLGCSGTHSPQRATPSATSHQSHTELHNCCKHIACLRKRRGYRAGS